jgi:hypothetical protein
MPLSNPLPAESLIFTRSLAVPGARAAVYRDVQRGRLTPVARGVYVETPLWNEATGEDRHRAMVRAAAELHPDVVFGGTSAGLIWKRPLLGALPPRPEGIVFDASGGRSNRGVRTRTTQTPFDIEFVDGIPVTALARTLVDVGRFARFSTAVAMLDHGLGATIAGDKFPASSRVTWPDLEAELARGTHVGRAKAKLALDFADPGAGSPGETLSRIEIARGGFPRPSLQREFHDAQGLIGFTDFFWEEFRLIGEFDGHGKYLRDVILRGRTTAEVVMAEKRREDRLRALGFLVIRWEWADLMAPQRLHLKLLNAGLRGGSSTRPQNVPPQD